MRLHQLRVRGISEAFRDQVSVDFGSLGPGLIAIVGENGAGKSTLIGSVFAALFRQLPGQKRSLYDFATHPEPEIELMFSVNGDRYRSLLKLDPRSRQMESYLFNDQGSPLTNGKREPFEEMIHKRIGTASFFLSSIFSSQKRTGNFLSLERSERKELFIRELLGLDRLRLIAAAARLRADEAAKHVAGLEGQRKSLAELVETDIEDSIDIDVELESVSSRLASLEPLKRDAEVRLGELQALEANRGALAAEVEALTRRVKKADAEIAAARCQIAQDERKITDGKSLVGLAQRSSALAARIEGLHREIQEVQKVESCNREIDRVLQALEVDLNASRAALERMQVESEELAVVPCGGQGEYALCPKIRRAVEAQQKLPTVEGEIVSMELEVEVQRGSLVKTKKTSADLTRTLESCDRERGALDQQQRRYEELRAIEARLAERVKALNRLARSREDSARELTTRESALTAFAELSSEHQSVRQRVADLNGSIACCRRERETLIARKAQFDQRHTQAEEARSRLAIVDVELATAKMKFEDFSYLARAFGPDEIQLCEIQAAGPEVTGLVNALLEGCFDNKFEVRFRTQRPRADGRGVVDDFDIEVCNKNLDRTCLVDELSGGQFVLVNEAVNLGIAIYNMHQGEGILHETLFRDETVGALDEANAKEYIRMLRRAMDIGGFHQVLFICHSPLVWELADRILEIHAGQVLLDTATGVSTPRPSHHRADVRPITQLEDE